MALYIVATPIGNLGDITIRALDTLKSADFILAEDTRVTRKLLNHFEIKTKMISFHEYSDEIVFEKVINLLHEGMGLALVTDSGTPGVSDPGARLVSIIRSDHPEIKIIPIPGPSALTAAMSVSGLSTSNMKFLGFIPKKKGRETFFKNLNRDLEEGLLVVFFESGHRIIKTIEMLNKYYPDCSITLAKELTKIFEEIITGQPFKVIEKLNEKNKTKGEFVVMVTK